MNIRKIGSYEITLYDIDDKRLSETVSHSSLWKAREIAEKLLLINKDAHSYTVSKITDNSKYNKWSPDQVKLGKEDE